MEKFDEILLSETTDIEFKESLEMIKPKSWLKSVSAFANGIGGCIYWGISDNRDVTGLSNEQQAIEKISEIIKARIEPMLLFNISPITIQSKTVL